jgi:hypothetical protein
VGLEAPPELGKQVVDPGSYMASVDVKAGVLSGGEHNHVYLARPHQLGYKLRMRDELTNDLDVAGCAIIIISQYRWSLSPPKSSHSKATATSKGSSATSTTMKTINDDRWE